MINSDSDLVTPLWTCYSPQQIYSPNNGHQYLKLLIQSGILPYSPNSLPMASKPNSTHGLLISSTLEADVWHLMGSFHLLSLSRLECSKAVFSVLGPVQFLISINDLSDSGKILFIYIFADSSTLRCDIPHPPDRQTAVSSLSGHTL